MKLSIVIPAHNEEHRLPPMLEAYGKYFSEKYGNDVELIVVPNFCDDRTADVAREIGQRYSQVKVIEEPDRVGKGGAVMIGARQAAGELVGFVDADGATPPEAFDDLVEHIGSAGCIIASRWMKGADVSPKQPLSRRFASRCFNLTVRLLFGLRLSDTQCGAKLFPRGMIQSILQNLGVTSWAFDVDMLFQARRAGAEIREIPTVWQDVAGSKIRIFQSSMNMIVALIRLRMVYSPLRWAVPYIARAVEAVYPYEKR
ncbi:MAG: dolichyl-phosphate beta-glucosyltransferase [Kiritimatiellales bacterium]